MKVLCLLVLLPLALAEQKRFLLDGIGDVVSADEVNNVVNKIMNQLGSDATEAQCEEACKNILNSALLDTACTFICNAFQTAVGNLPHGGSATAAPANPDAPAKRFIEGLLDSSMVQNTVHQIMAQIGSDATEQQCETACMNIFNNALLDTSCPLICNAFQTAAQAVDPAAGGAAKKRFIEGILDSSMVQNTAHQILAQIGSDATEQQCETACMNIFNNALLDTSCPLICNAVQTLAQQIDPVGAVAGKKRFIEGILDSSMVQNTAHQILAQIGSDATEQQCETACMNIFNNALLDTSCPLICNAVQTLAQQIDPVGTVAGKKRFIEGLLDSSMVKNTLHQILAQVGSDATEQQCESACMNIFNNALLDTSCPLICNSFQTFAQSVDPAGQQKRFVLDTLGIDQLEQIFSTGDLKHYVNQIVELVGSDASEQQCESACMEVMKTQILDASCPLLCLSFQQLVKMFHSEEVMASAAPVNKRLIFDNFHFDLTSLLSMFSAADLTKYLNQIVDKVGSDETEATCETACLEVMNNELLDTACPLICNSFQALIQNFHIEAPSDAPPAAAAAPSS